jgi:adenylate cyclase
MLIHGDNAAVNRTPQVAQQKVTTILFADLRGFSLLAASYPPQAVLDMLNRCLTRMSEIVVRHGGAIDKFIGDAVMAVFSGRTPREDAMQAVICAAQMQIAMDALNEEHRRLELPELYMGIGLNSGKVIAGRVGSDVYSTLTVIGEEVNIAARIEAFCLRGQILISEGTHALAGEVARTGEPMELFVKGSEAGLMVREVLGIPSLGKDIPRHERRRSPRVDVRLPFSYQLLASGVVSPQRAKGTILDLGYNGTGAELDREIGLYGELKLEVDLPLVSYKATDIYGRVVNSKPEGDRFAVGIEFTSLSPATSRNIHQLVHMLMTKPPGWR